MCKIDWSNAMGTAAGDGQHMLGKFLYFSLANVLVEKTALSELCKEMEMPYSGGSRLTASDAFRSATGDIRDRIAVTGAGEQKIISIYCRDNVQTGDMMSRELVKETLNRRTNRYEKLANIYFDKSDLRFGYDDIVCDEDVDVLDFCRRAEELFELYQRCANRRQIETICTNYLRMLEATKVTGTGHNYFVPRQNMERVDLLEDFMEAVNERNLNQNVRLSANSFFIIDDDKQRNKMTEEFYSAVRREIMAYQERADYLITSGSTSPSVMERWINKITLLEEKKRHYEEVLRRELDGLDDEFDTLKFLSQELSIRVRGLRANHAA